MTTADMVEEASRRGNHDIGAAAERFCLRLHADATVYRHRFHLAVPAVGLCPAEHLLGQLPRGDQDEGPDASVGTVLEPL